MSTSTFLSSVVVAASLVLAVFACSNSSKVSSRPTENSSIMNPSATSFYQFTVNSLDGKPVSMSDFKGKKVVILNVASKCGYTPQYADWE
jgi:glutathione peroxidase